MAEKPYKEPVQELVQEIQGLKPRIDELLAVANACLRDGIDIDVDYESGSFFTNNLSHKLGFVKDWSYFGQGPDRITMLGINPGGMCGPYHFRTDGETVQFVHKTSRFDTMDASFNVDVLREFVESFDAFESAFYAYADKALQEHRQSLDSILADAGARSICAPRSDAEAERSFAPQGIEYRE